MAECVRKKEKYAFSQSKEKAVRTRGPETDWVWDFNQPKQEETMVWARDKWGVRNESF